MQSLRAGDLSPVHLPIIEDEACRDPIRARDAARRDLKQAWYRLRAFLLIRCAKRRRRQWRFFTVVEALQALRGAQFTASIGLMAELSDLSRVDHPRQLMAWLGVTPSEHSSGQRRQLGSITRTGGSYARCLLIEAAWSYRHPAKVSPAIQKRHDRLSKVIIDRASDAQLRLCKRYRKLAARGKHRNVAVLAIACELAGFIWDIARIAIPAAVQAA